MMIDFTFGTIILSIQAELSFWKKQREGRPNSSVMQEENEYYVKDKSLFGGAGECGDGKGVGFGPGGRRPEFYSQFCHRPNVELSILHYLSLFSLQSFFCIVHLDSNLFRATVVFCYISL